MRFGFFIKNYFSDSLCKKISLIIAATPTHPSKNIIDLCIILWIFVQSDTVNDLIQFGGHCYLYILVQRFCLVSLTISNRQTSYRSLKQTAGSTRSPWTTILVMGLNVLVYNICRCAWEETSWDDMFFGIKHPGNHKVLATHHLGRNTGSRRKFQVIVLEGCQGETISLHTLPKCRIVCNLCCIVYFL